MKGEIFKELHTRSEVRVISATSSARSLRHQFEREQCFGHCLVWFITSKMKENVRPIFTGDSRKLKGTKETKREFTLILSNETAARVYQREPVRFESPIMTTHAASQSELSLEIKSNLVKRDC